MSIKRDVFLKPPREVIANKLWKLKTTVYELCDVPRIWHSSVKKELPTTVCIKSRQDNGIF